jgi:hypothetical protein
LSLCALTTVLFLPSLSSATSVIITYIWCILLVYLPSDLLVHSLLSETPPLRVVKSAIVWLSKFQLEPDDPQV